MAMEASETLMYAQYGVATLLVFLFVGLTLVLVRWLAKLLIWLFIGFAMGVVCMGIYNGSFSTWAELLTGSALAGVGAGLLCTPLLPLAGATTKSAPQPSAITGEALQRVE